MRLRRTFWLRYLCTVAAVVITDVRWLPSDPIGIGEAAVLAAAKPHATSYTVNTLDDTSGNGDCSLRDAVNAANGTPTLGSTCTIVGSGNDTIQFNVTGTIFLASTLPRLTDTLLTINGPASPGITIDGRGAVRVIVVASGARANFRNLTMFDGSTEGAGGGILNSGTLSITRSTFSGNRALVGGAIFNDGTLSIGNSTFSGSNDSAEGGGIFNDGTLRVTNSTFSGNDAGDGGGILNAGTLTVTNSTFSSNRAGDGGGIFNDSTLIVTSSTFAGGNAARGAGIFNRWTANITNCTFAMNSASTGGGVFNSDSLTISNSTFSGNDAASGGGMQNYGHASVESTILAASTFGGNCSGTIADAGYNVSDDTSCGFAKTGSANNGDGVDPLLSTVGLANNGGPTKTIALRSASPALDAIPLADCTDQASPPNRIITDQRGFPRPDPDEDICDIGAYESQATFAGEPGTAKCQKVSVSVLVQQSGSINAIAPALGYPSERALQDAIKAFCRG